LELKLKTVARKVKDMKKEEKRCGMTRQEAMDLETKCDQLMSEYLRTKCNVSLALSGKFKVCFDDNYITFDKKDMSVVYVNVHGYYSDLKVTVNFIVRCVSENRELFDKLIWSYEHISELN